MFTISQIPNSKEFKNNSINHTFLAKKIIKVIRFFSHREKSLNDNVNNVKYNHIIHIIKKYLENKKADPIFEDLVKNLKTYIQEKTNINDYVLDEIMILFFSCISKQKIIKKELLEEINSNISTIEYFFKQDVYHEKKRNKSNKLQVEVIREIINQKDYEDFYHFFFYFCNSFIFYNRLLKSEYNYVLKSNFLINYSHLFSDDFLNKYKNILENLNLYKNILDLKKLLVDYTNNLNLELFTSNKNIDTSFYLQEEKNNVYIESEVLNYNFYCLYHGGERFGSFTKNDEPKSKLKKKEMEIKFKNMDVLKNIIFHKSNIIELETHYNVFLFKIDKNNDLLFFMNSEYDILNTHNISHFSQIKTFIYQNKEKSIKTDLKTDFLFKSEHDYYEKVFIDDKGEDVFKIRFYMNKYQIIDIINKKNIEHNYGFNNN